MELGDPRRWFCFELNEYPLRIPVGRIFILALAIP
jgi:hypothetical protein